ncbi:MAG: hypothetical protein EOM72_01090 [Opitutae bacterium]|nr:hypothetical protein [Opitutae bacterium]
MKIKGWVGWVLLAGVLSARAQGVPDLFNYQGVLRGGSGEFLAAGSYDVGFRLYAVATGGSAVWGRQYAVLVDSNGLFNVELDDGAGSELIADATLPATVSGHAALYLGLTVQGSTEIAPRQRLLAVPYALRAGDVKAAAGDFEVTGILRANGGALVEGTAQVGTSLQVGTGAGIATLTIVDGALKVDTKFAGHGTVPVGAILMWSGTTNTIPDGWSLCNGQNGTPDLRDRFIMGAGNHYGVSATGGVASVTLSTNQLPPHSHTFKDAYYAESVVPSKTPTGGGGYIDLGYEVTGSGNHDADNNYMYYRHMTTDNTGAGSSVPILPPYFALCYIMRMQ